MDVGVGKGGVECSYQAVAKREREREIGRAIESNFNDHLITALLKALSSSLLSIYSFSLFISVSIRLSVCQLHYS